MKFWVVKLAISNFLYIELNTWVPSTSLYRELTVIQKRNILSKLSKPLELIKESGVGGLVIFLSAPEYFRWDHSMQQN